MKLNRPWTGPWEVIKRLSEVVYRIKYCGPAGSYSRVKRRVVHFNQLKPFNGASDKGQSWVAVESGPTEVLRPSAIIVNSDAGVIVLENDIFPEAAAEAPSEDPVLVQHHSEEDLSERGIHPSERRTIKRTLKGLFEILMMNST